LSKSESYLFAQTCVKMYLAVLILASFIVQISFLKENVHEFCSLETCRSYFHF